MIQKILVVLFFVLWMVTIGVGLTYAYGGEAKGRRIQEVNFDGSDVDGEARRPEGAYLVQKRGIDFEPLYNVRRQFDESIRDSVDHLR